jgi:primosomal protein N'
LSLDVVEEAHVAFFSFAKFLLWRDLVDHEPELLRHDLVRHLVHGDRGKELLAGEPFVEPRDLDRERPLGASRLVLDADASQRVAIDAALRGRSFVLQGPPGTGKSQTIANLIAECLAAGKRVLFVAEKQAALEVVARRLERVGLGDLCLELHSQKASKREVIAELASLLDPPRARGISAAVERGERAQEVGELAA